VGVDESSLLLATKILERTPHNNSPEEIMNLGKQIALLSEQDMLKLSVTLLNNTRNSLRNFRDFIAEHNFGADLVRKNNNKEYVIEYEPDRFQCPPDFVITRNEVTYFLQMKKLSLSERENRRTKLIQEMKRGFEKIPCCKFISLKFHESFDGADANQLISFLSSTVLALPEGTEYSFPPNGDNPKATYTVYSPNIKSLNHLTIGVTGDLNMVEVTGEAESQVIGSLTKASGAFDWDTDEQRINLVVMEADHYDNIDISQAVFGTEIYLMNPQGKYAWKRGSEGFFSIKEYATKVCGVIAVRRSDYALITSYKKTLFINEPFKHMIDRILEVVIIDEILTISDLPGSD